MRSACACAVVAAWISACASNDAIHQLPESSDARPPGTGGPGAVPAPAGTPPAAPLSCGGLDLPAPPMRGYSFKNETVRATGAAMDGRGVLALLSQRDATPENKNIDFTATDGTWLGYDIGEMLREIQPLRHGFAGIGYINGSQGAYTVRFLATGTTLFDVIVQQAWGLPDIASHPSSSGFLVAGTFRDDYPSPVKAEARWMDGTGPPVLVASSPLASKQPIVTAGMDADRNMLVVFGSQIAGELAGQWFAPGGRPLTGLFTLMTDFQLGANTAVELTAAVGGGLLVTRADREILGTDLRTRHLCQIAPGATACLPVPAWMENRPDTRLRAVRGGRAWAALTTEHEAVDCADRIEVVAADGTSCGSTELRMAAGTCDRLALTVGSEGTVVQTLPRGVRMPNGDNVGWRWWPEMLR